MRAVFLAGALLAALAPAAAQDKDMEAARAKTQVCAACHGPDGNAVSADFPSLAGQTWRYLYIQLKDYQEGRRSNRLGDVENTTTRNLCHMPSLITACDYQP